MVRDISQRWQPSASIDVLKKRAQLLVTAREYLNASGAYEVETPALSHFASSELHLSSWQAQTISENNKQAYLHTSPELFMKRLLAAGSGDIYQFCKVFRADEQGRQHNPEFTMLEWYRHDLSMQEMMDAVANFVQSCLDRNNAAKNNNKISIIKSTYQDLFQTHVKLDPFSIGTDELANWAKINIQNDIVGMQSASKDDWLDLIMTHCIEPKLDKKALTFVYHYPASQASLARLDKDNSSLAERFELYYAGMELANGFHELADGYEQRARMDNENKQRVELDLPVIAYDEFFLASLDAGLPDCCGVAIGIDRLIMAGLNTPQISDVVSFDFSRV